MVYIETWLLESVLERAGLPTMVRLENMPDAKTLAAIRRIAKAHKKKYAEFLAGINVVDFVRNKGNIWFNYETSNWAYSSDGAYPDSQTTTRVASWNDFQWRNFDVEKIKADLAPLVPSRFELFYDEDQKALMLRAPRLSNEANVAIRNEVYEAMPYRSNKSTSIRFYHDYDYNSGDNYDYADYNTIDGFLNFVVKMTGLGPAKLYRAQLLKRLGQRMEYPVPTHDTSKNLSAFLRKRRSTHFPYEEVARDNVDTLTLANHGVLASRSWGIEVEAAGARGVQAPKGWRRKSDGSLRSAYESGTYIDPMDCPEYNHREILDEAEVYVYMGDIIPGDGEDGGTEAPTSAYYTVYNVENEDYSDPEYCDYCGDVERSFWNSGSRDDTGEFVSPILKSFHSRGLESLLVELNEEPQNDTAGVHVHVEARDLSLKQIGNLVFAYEMIEPLIETSYRRNEREYCKQRSLDEVMSVLGQAKKRKYKTYEEAYADTSGNASGKYLDAGDRYVTLNLCSLSAHGTVEFRAMGPVYEYEHLIKWAHFCREMVNMAKNDVPLKEWSAVKSFADVRALFSKYGSEASDAVFEGMSSLAEIDAETAIESLVAEV